MNNIKLDCPRKCYNFIKPLIKDFSQEHLFVITLDSENNLISSHLVFLGTVEDVFCHPREIFKKAILDSAAKIVVAHNHFNNNMKMSDNDIDCLKRLKESGDLLGIPLVEFMVVCEDGYTDINRDGVRFRKKKNIDNKTKIG